MSNNEKTPQIKLPFSEFAIASLVLGIVSFVQILNLEKAIVAITFGILALKKINKNENDVKGKKLAIAGIIIGIIYIITSLIILYFYWPQMIELQEKLKQTS